MVDSETIEAKVSDKKEKIDEKIDEGKEKIDETKEKIEDKKEKSKNIADNVMNDLYTSIDEFKDYIKNMQKSADKKYADYKKSTVQTLDIDLVETKDIYYIKAAVPGAEKEDVLIEAGDNDITIETTFKPYIEEFAEDEEAELIASSIKSGRCVKTVRFETSIDLENITAKFSNGIIIVTIPKLIIPKHKVNVE
ncbi:Hsp20/alpha crystallin family protein [uncultured Methanobrevibacter sp.]|uniref:Hsp20/alpha crystallin family protein n=1 Tax=uncultured Methanobrevibacter sp. TaxID=253161 RepID=UPI0025FA47D9|nr:Hsp20/alpha crystallin family protein [uncultured Methanobrevibacter sp.]MEE1133848.1 Hsp20/alpha crystallin family protein [Methanobrevibacter sp.]